MILSRTLILVSLLLALACRRGDEKKSENNDRLVGLLLISQSGVDTDPVATSLEQSLDSATQAMESITSDGLTLAGFSPKIEETESKGFFDTWKNFTFSSELMAATFSANYNCLGGGSISRTWEATSTPFTGTGPTTVFGVREFSNCALFPTSRFIINGKRESHWNNLNTANPYIQVGTTLNIALDRTLVDRVRGFNIQIRGTRATITGGTQKISASAEWTAVTGSSSSYTVELSEQRSAANVRGNAIFDHSITTPTPLTHALSGSGINRVRTVNGQIKIQHNLLNFETLVTFNNVVWSAVDCRPSSGTATITVSGSRTASGIVTFADGSASYSYSGASGSASGTITLKTCTSSI